MDLTEDLVERVVLAAKEIDYGDVIISIAGQPNNKTVDIITKKRDRYRECYMPDEKGGHKYEKV